MCLYVTTHPSSVCSYNVSVKKKKSKIINIVKEEAAGREVGRKAYWGLKWRKLSHALMTSST